MSYEKDIKCAAFANLPWELLNNVNILIAGATGLIGSCIVEVLMERTIRNYHIYAMGRNKERMNKLFGKYIGANGFDIVVGDVTQPLPLNIPIHYVIHAASGAAPVDFSQHPVEVMKANINGVANLMEYGLQHEMRRFLYVSSGEVYGEGDGRVFTEDYSGYVDCTTPRSCYPSSKRAAETLCASFAAEYGVDVVIARPCHTYGPHFTENDNRVYAQFIKNVLDSKDIEIKSTGEQFRSWCYVVDSVSAILTVLLKGKNGEAYNIADKDSNINIRSLAEIIAGIGNRRVVMSVPSESEKKGFNKVKRSLYDTSKIENLGWKLLSGDIREKLERTIKYLQK